MAKKKPEKKGAKKGPPKAGPKKKGKGGGYLPVIIVAFLTVVIGIIILSYLGKGPGPKAGEKEVSIYVSDDEGTALKAEKVKIPTGDLEKEAKSAIEKLLQKSDVIPENTKLLKLSIKDGLAAIDLSRRLIEGHTGGSSAEIQTAYAIVNTLTLNFPEIKEVQILIEGKKEKTIAGHIDISQPLGQDKKVVKN